MGKLRRTPTTWWLLAAPVAGLTVGLVLGAVVGLVSTPPGGEIRPLAGDPVGSTAVGAVVGLSGGVFSGLAVAAVLAFAVGPELSLGIARLRASAVAAVVCPLLLLIVLAVARVDLAQIEPGGLVGVTVVAAVTCAWLAGRVPGRTSGQR